MCKKITSFLLFICFVIFNFSFLCSADEVELSALSAVVICTDDNQIIFAKNPYQKLPMASTTKIMTSLLALEKASTGDIDIAITDKMLPVEGSSMHLQVGNVLPLSSLAKGMLTVSGNDAANAVAISLGGSLELFADMMNEKASIIGMNKTHFVTPSGLDDAEHYSTAYDMALLGAYALENEDFYNISSKRKVDVPFNEPNETLTFYNENRMLRRYDGCIGVKTGFTKSAGRCLVSGAEKDGVRLVAVTLNAPDDWNDHEKMLDFGFSKLQSVNFEDNELYRLPIVGSDEEKIIAKASGPIKFLVLRDRRENLQRNVELPQFVYSPIKEGDIIGKIQYTLDGKVIATNPLLAQKDDNKSSKAKNIIKKCIEFFQRILKKTENLDGK